MIPLGNAWNIVNILEEAAELLDNNNGQDRD
jgi:hypothetical protein